MELPQHLFDYISAITPLVNVELVLKDCSPSILLAWRDDGLYGPGWHLPGGVVRHKESVICRVKRVAESECGIVEYESCELLQINQIMNPNRDLRGHFISFVFGIKASSQFTQKPSELVDGTCKAFKIIPPNLIQQHQRYHSLINGFLANTHNNAISPGNLLLSYHPSHEN